MSYRFRISTLLGVIFFSIMWASGFSAQILASPNGAPTPDPAFAAIKPAKIAFSAGQPQAIYTVNIDGTDLKKLTKIASAEHNPIWSPDGNKILFNRIVFDRDKLFVMN